MRSQEERGKRSKQKLQKRNAGQKKSEAATPESDHESNLGETDDGDLSATDLGAEKKSRLSEVCPAMMEAVIGNEAVIAIIDSLGECGVRFQNVDSSAEWFRIYCNHDGSFGCEKDLWLTQWWQSLHVQNNNDGLVFKDIFGAACTLEAAQDCKWPKIGTDVLEAPVFFHLRTVHGEDVTFVLCEANGCIEALKYMMESVKEIGPQVVEFIRMLFVQEDF